MTARIDLKRINLWNNWSTVFSFFLSSFFLPSFHPSFLLTGFVFTSLHVISSWWFLEGHLASDSVWKLCFTRWKEQRDSNWWSVLCRYSKSLKIIKKVTQENFLGPYLTICLTIFQNHYLKHEINLIIIIITNIYTG